MILTIKTDQPDTEIGLYKQSKRACYIKWPAGRNLSSDIHKKINVLLRESKTDFSDLQGIILYKGPGSFTGLRIGAAVANTLAFELDVPIAGTSDKNWIKTGIALLEKQPNNRLVQLEYGAPPHITTPKK